MKVLIMSSNFTPTKRKKCKLCGDLFWPESRNQRYCKKVHTSKCPICGEEIIISNAKQVGKCCSQKCKAELRKQTNLSRYGVENAACFEEFQEKRRNTCIEKYGADTPFLMDDFQEKRKDTSLKKYGVDDPMRSDVVKQHHRESIEKKYGHKTPLTLPQAREALLEMYSNPEKVREIAEKRGITRNHIIANDGTRLDSNYEKVVYEYFKRLGSNIERNIPIEIEYEGKIHTTLIDFKIDDILIEVKGAHLLSGIYDYNPLMIPIEEKFKAYIKNSVFIITNTESKEILESADLKGIDVKLFDNPIFPYREDRPKCFYDVKVRGERSIFESFQDESIRWKMIKNRLKYSDNHFIESKDIIRALNVTRECKQPSWFSKTFAKNIIKKYVTTDVIVDPFAGWGGRAQASKELNKQYIGIDLNEELVKWHHEQGFDNISYGDAKEFKYDEECSVFICPPYQDIEVYFDEQDNSLTQCQWLEIVMDNVPNAKEYIMVCKIVDPGWEQYIVETKINKSHFGENTEYVLVIQQ